MGKEAALGVIALLFGVGGGISSFPGTMISGALQFNQLHLSTVLVSSISKPQALAFIFAFFSTCRVWRLLLLPVLRHILLNGRCCSLCIIWLRRS